jgi:phosphomannomutase
MDLFGTAGIRGSAEQRVTPALALAVGRAAGRAALEDADEARFVVGRDGRTTGPALAAAVEAGLLSAGVEVTRVGVVPTPALAFASRDGHGVMLTASHNPPTDNGIKLFADGQEYPRERERRIEQLVAAEPSPASWDRWPASTRAEPLSDYRDAVTAYAREHGAPLAGRSVAVDCGNGMASLATPHVLRQLGAHVVTLNANVDGHFPGRESKPTAESLVDLRQFVADGEFAFGVGHDGDADRMVVVDADGEVVHEDTVVAVVAEHYVRSSDVPDPVVVTTPNASARIDDRVRAAGGRVERVRLGALHEGIARVERAGGDVVFAAEPWKHIHPGLGGWIDGVASAAVFARLVAAAGTDEAPPGDGVRALREPVRERPYRKASVDCPDDVKAVVMDRLETRLPERYPEASVNTEYGVRLELPDAAWTLVRPSGTEPYVRIYAESDAVDELLDGVRDAVRDAVADAT